MSIAALEFFGKRMEKALPGHCAFMRWNTHPPDDYYFTYEYAESPGMYAEENGRRDTTVYIRGYTWGNWLSLEEAKERIEKIVPTTAILENGSGIAIFYDAASVVPTGLDDLKSIKIDMTIQEWKVN